MSAWEKIERKLDDGVHDLFEKLERVREEVEWTEVQLAANLRSHGQRELAEMYENWIEEGE